MIGAISFITCCVDPSRKMSQLAVGSVYFTEKLCFMSAPSHGGAKLLDANVVRVGGS
jgi:hypothetical protein